VNLTNKKLRAAGLVTWTSPHLRQGMGGEHPLPLAVQKYNNKF